jgi:hypothetical protein
VNKNFKPRDQAKHDTQGIALIATTDAQPPSPPLKRAPSSEKAASNKPASFTAKTEPTLRTHSTTANDDTTIAIKDGRATTIVKATSALPTNVASIAKVKPNAATGLYVGQCIEVMRLVHDVDWHPLKISAEDSLDIEASGVDRNEDPNRSLEYLRERLGFC